MIVIILMVEIGHVTETDHTIEIGHIVETGTTAKNTKETGHTLQIDHMTEIIHRVEVDRKTIPKVTIKMTTEMIIEMKIIEMREGLEIILKMLMKTGTARINIDTNTRMTAMTEIEVGLEKEVPCLRQGKLLPG